MPGRDEAVMAELRKPEFRDPRGFIIPSNQADFPTAVKFINALREVGIKVQRATREFEVQGKKYPAGSFVVMGAQSFRPHVIDMFEPQDHPDNIPYAGAAPTPPYDHAGWTLAFQMGVEFDRILDGFTGPFEPVTDWNVKPPAGTVTTVRGGGRLPRLASTRGFVRRAQPLLAANGRLWLQLAAERRRIRYVPARAGQRRPARRSRRSPPSSASAPKRPAEKPPANALKLRRPRVGLWDQYGGSMDSGWARWILEQYQFPFEKVFPPMLDAGNLNAKYDVLVFVEGGIPAIGAARRRGAQPAAADIPGRVSADARENDRRAHDTGAAALRRKRRHGDHDRRRRRPTWRSTSSCRSPIISWKTASRCPRPSSMRRARC